VPDASPSARSKADARPPLSGPDPAGRLTVIVLGYDSRPDLPECFASLVRMPPAGGPVQLMFVDNASSDDSSAWVAERFPQVAVVRSERNLGFAGGNNLGARQAHTPWLAFLNPDMRVAADWLVEAFRVIDADPTVDCVACRLMSWDGTLVDYAGGSMNFYGYGMQDGVGAPPTEASREDRDVLFACGGAMLVSRAVFLAVGGFDESYFAFLEDVDLGWRLWLSGHRVRYAGRAVVYHRHHGSWSRASDRRRQTLMERNALFSVLKNYETPNLQAALPAAVQLMAFRAFLSAGIDPAAYRPSKPAVLSGPWGPLRWLGDALRYYGPLVWGTLRRDGPIALTRKTASGLRRRRSGLRPAVVLDPGGGDEPGLAGAATLLPDRTLAYLDAARAVLDGYDQAMARRSAVQASRRRPDRELLPLFGKALVPNYPDREHFRALQIACDVWSLYERFAP
jgi:GT2 family glycosyltransferase